MNYCKSILLLCLILFLLECPLFAQQTSKTKPSSQLQEFIDKTGFTGDFTPVDDGRLFSKLNGKFNLPVPQDSLALCNNTDFIISSLDAIYRQGGSNYILKRTSYQHQYSSCQYLQYWKNYYLEHQAFYLLITYHRDSNTYSVYNNLYTLSVHIPDKVISVQTAIKLGDFVMDNSNLNPDLDSIPLDYVSTDTTKVVYSYLKTGYGNYQIYLNLYPVVPGEASSGFKLQWIRPDGYGWGNIYSRNLFIDAATGELLHDLKTIWQLKVPLVLAGNHFLKSTGLIGKAYVSYSPNNEFNGFEFNHEFTDGTTIRDTTSMLKVANRYIPYLADMFKQLGFEFKVDYIKTKRETTYSGNVWYESIYYQSYRYPINTYGWGDVFPWGVRITFDATSQILKVSAKSLNKIITYPKHVISHNSVMEIHLNSGLRNEARAMKVNQLLNDKVALSKIPRNNLYCNNNYIIQLCMQPIYSDVYGIYDVRLSWFIINTQKEPKYSNYEHTYIDPVTGGNPYDDIRPSYEEESDYEERMQGIPNPDEANIIEREFAPLGIITKYTLGTKTGKIRSFHAILNLPVPQDSLQLLQNAYIIIDHLLNLHNVNYVGLELIPDPLVYYSEQPSITFNLYYQGFRLMSSEGYPYWDSTIKIGFSQYDSSYGVYWSLPDDMSNFVELIPSCIITPETALYMTENKALDYNWAELSFFNGNHNYWLDYEEPYESPYETDDYDIIGYLNLHLYPFKPKDAPDSGYKYRLVWLLMEEGHAVTIDAETGEILKEEWWDTC